ncbi:MAG TPA: DUF2127 domain-containing protein [Solirubrobacteraceae bacterium]
MSPRLPGPRIRRRIGWELVVCGWKGHVLVGTDAAKLRPQDALVAREYDGYRWYRCLRCDSWIPLPPPVEPAREHPPERDEIEIPARGQALRDKIVLRLIAVDRAFHFVVLALLGVVVLILAANQKTAHGDFERVLTALQGGVAGGPVQTRGHVGILGELDKLFSLRAHTLYVVGIALLAYGALEGIEAVGLWFAKRWAEYLTFIATALLLPLEVYEIVNRVSVLKVIGFAINVAIVIYLVYAKRLFGLRGGGRVDEARRAASMSWRELESTAPPVRVAGA